MPDIIHLLPNSVANQIAAGEVIQRPASAVKEMLENAIDSGADKIELVIKDAGKTLIQITDNGCGMSETDARLSFERHATSKISSVQDLSSIRTMGFRGEALASITAISHVEMKTKRHGAELGTHIIIEASEVKSQEFCQCPPGTTIMVKNIFFNIPARRKFLKSDNVELRNIIEEFQRIALANPEISFSLYNDRKIIFQLSPSNLKQRIVNIYNTTYNRRLIPVEESLNIVKVNGFIGKPEFARKQRGEQYFFVNKRFIRHPYLNHAVENAYDELLPEKSFPSYFLFLEIDPAIIDVNIHPTKTEIKFEDEKIIYSVLKSAVKAALGKFSITPAIDFDVEPLFDFPTRTKDASTKQPTVGFNPDYNPFEKRQAPLTPRQISNRDNWDKMIPPKDFSFGKETDSNTDSVPKLIEDDNSDMAIQLPESNFLQLHRKYIITQVKSGLMIIDQQRAHERIMYERYLELLSKRVTISQQVLFGVKISLSAGDSELLNEIMEDLNLLGFNIKADKNKPFQYIAEGIPAGTEIENVPDTIDRILHNYKQGLIEFAQSKRVNLARSMAKNLSVKTGKVLQQAEMKTITEELFSCQAPEVSLDGEPTVKVININKYFNHKE